MEEWDEREESFLRRWSRLKRAPAVADAVVPVASPLATPAADAAVPAAPLPAVDSLELSSDFLPFMQGEVEEGVRRAALQKLFAAEHFNVMDGLDTYIDDYNKFEPIGEEMLQQLMQAPGLRNDFVQDPAAEPEVIAASADAAVAVGVADEVRDEINGEINGEMKGAADKTHE